MTDTRLKHVSMDGNAKWIKHATEAELASLAGLMLSAARHNTILVKRRQLIRDRCYARARRSADKER